MDWTSVGAGALASGFIAILLWAFLPRGVVLTRTLLSDVRQPIAREEDVWDRWLVRNESPLPVRILRVRLRDFSGERDLSTDEPDESGVLVFDDEVADATRYEQGFSWSNAVLPPGDALIAHVLTNQDLTIAYRRAGWSGVFERRQIGIHSGA